MPFSIFKSLDFFDLEAAIWTTSEPLRRGALGLDRPGFAISAVLPAKPAARRVGDKRCVGDKTFRHFRVSVMFKFGVSVLRNNFAFNFEICFAVSTSFSPGNHG